MDEIAAGTLNVEITVVISDKKDAFALERAEKAGIKAVAIDRKECASKEEFENKITGVLEAAGAELVVLAGFMRILSPEFVGTGTIKSLISTRRFCRVFQDLTGRARRLITA